MKSLLILVDSIVTIYIWILIINAILSWLIAFNILNFTLNDFNGLIVLIDRLVIV